MRFLLNTQELDILKNVDVRNVALDDLIDIRNVNIDSSKCVEERIIDFIRQIKNPYVFKVDDVAVKVNFNENGPTFQEKFQNFLKECIKK